MSRAGVRDRVVYATKWTLAQALDVSGVMALRRRQALRHRAVVLAYHRVLPEGAETWSHPGIVVTPATFERHMRILQREFRLLSLQQFEHHIATGTPFEPGSCLVTFDDGWIDTYTEAWPILRRLRVPAVVFLPTRYIGSSDTFWQERLGMLLCEAGKALRDDPLFRARLFEVLQSCGLAHLIDLVERTDKAAILDSVRGLKLNQSVSPSETTSRLASLLGTRAALNHGDQFMAWHQVRDMARDGLAFGVHGHNHRILTMLSAEEVSEELDTARAIIQREVGHPVTSMSYPNGGWSESVVERVRALGFAVAFSMQRGHTAVSDSVHSIGRMNIHEGLTGSDALFRARILGVF